MYDFAFITGHSAEGYSKELVIAPTEYAKRGKLNYREYGGSSPTEESEKYYDEHPFIKEISILLISCFGVELTEEELEASKKSNEYVKSLKGRVGTDWWLRSPAEINNDQHATACIVSLLGGLQEGNSGIRVQSEKIGVRPAIYISIKD